MHVDIEQVPGGWSVNIHLLTHSTVIALCASRDEALNRALSTEQRIYALIEQAIDKEQL